MNQFTTRQLTMAAVVGAGYFVLTMAGYSFAFGLVQCRISEALTVLPFFFPNTIWGLFVGCILSNMLGGYGVLDIVFGSLATLIAGYLTSKMKSKWLAPLPPVLVNGIVIGAMLAYVTAPDNFWPSFVIIGAQVAAGQFLACYVLGLPLMTALPKIKFFREMMTR